MKLTNEMTRNAHKRAVKDMHAEGKPTSGLVHAVAAIRTLRDLSKADFSGKPDATWSGQEVVDAIHESYAELLRQIQERDKKGKLVYTLEGFACNASAAAKAAGYSDTSTQLDEAD